MKIILKTYKVLKNIDEVYNVFMEENRYERVIFTEFEKYKN